MCDNGDDSEAEATSSTAICSEASSSFLTDTEKREIENYMDYMENYIVPKVENRMKLRAIITELKSRKAI